MLPSIPKGRPKPLQIDLSPDTKSNHPRHSYDPDHRRDAYATFQIFPSS
jgi:hypothetical protein